MIKCSKRSIRRRQQCVIYIAKESQDWLTAWRWEDDVFESVERLEDFPESGSIVRELGRDDIREIFVGDYRIIYRIRRHAPEILTVRHTRRLITTLQAL